MQHINIDKNHYEQHGYVILRAFLNDDDLADIIVNIDPIYQVWRDNNQEQIAQNALVNMHSLTHSHFFKNNKNARVKLFNTLANKKLITKLIHLFGEGIYFHNTQLFFNPINKEQQPYWHRDMQYSPIDDAQQSKEQSNMLSLHVRIPLQEETGLAVIKGTHKRWDTEQEHNVRFELNGHKSNEPLPDNELITLKLGDILIFNAQMIHRGNYDQNDTRKALDLCVGKYHPLSSQFFDKSVLPTEQEMAQLTNPSWYQEAYKVLACQNR
ncbi:phytanoyl-CoA dioxygenase [Marinomonas agarivorans]|nr:phytanoyl-CoA dioxygenase [Marinomonas agarivorans]